MHNESYLYWDLLTLKLFKYKSREFIEVELFFSLATIGFSSFIGGCILGASATSIGFLIYFLYHKRNNVLNNANIKARQCRSPCREVVYEDISHNFTIASTAIEVNHNNAFLINDSKRRAFFFPYNKISNEGVSL